MHVFEIHSKSKDLQRIYFKTLLLLKYICIYFFTDPPIVDLNLGSTLNADDIKEGDDVYFECKVRANPHWRRLTWLHNVSKQQYT